MNKYRGLFLVSGILVALLITGCATTEKTASTGDTLVAAADMSQAKCTNPCDKSSDPAKAACCEKRKAEGKCPMAAGEKKADKECPHKKASSDDKAKKSSGCPKAKAAEAQK